MQVYFTTVNIKSVRFHPYRTTRAWPIICSMPQEWIEVENWRKYLADKSGTNQDNHTVYEVEYENGGKVCFWFSDLKMHIALKADNKAY